MGLVRLHGAGETAWGWRDCMGLVRLHGAGETAWGWRDCMDVQAHLIV